MEITIARGETVAIRAYAEHIAQLAKEAADRRLAASGAFGVEQSEMYNDALTVAHLCDKIAEHLELEPAAVSVNIGSQFFGQYVPDIIRHGRAFDWRAHYAA